MFEECEFGGKDVPQKNPQPLILLNNNDSTVGVPYFLQIEFLQQCLHISDCATIFHEWIC
jgi:hypothetical protein